MEGCGRPAKACAITSVPSSRKRRPGNRRDGNVYGDGKREAQDEYKHHICDVFDFVADKAVADGASLPSFFESGKSGKSTTMAVK